MFEVSVKRLALVAIAVYASSIQAAWRDCKALLLRGIGFPNQPLSSSPEDDAKRGKKTAEAMAAGRAFGYSDLDQIVRNSDHLAYGFLSSYWRTLHHPLFRSTARRLYERKLPGAYLSLQARTKHFDAVLLEELENGIEQFVILGAGFDSRPYRFQKQLEKIKVFEVDHPGTAAWKRERLKSLGLSIDHVNFVTIDFNSDSLLERLEANGLEVGRKTLFFWEGVTFYLTEDAVKSTLVTVSKMASGSSILFDYCYRDALLNPEKYLGAKEWLNYVTQKNEPFQFGLNYDELAAFLSPFNLIVDSNLSPEERTKYYLTGPNGDSRGPIVDFIAVAHARLQ